MHNICLPIKFVIIDIILLPFLLGSLAFYSFAVVFILIYVSFIPVYLLYFVLYCKQEPAANQF